MQQSETAAGAPAAKPAATRTTRSGWIAAAALALTLAAVFLLQVPDNGFRRGHRGWVTAHTMAIIQRATAANGFVGYAMSYEMPAGRELYYFDRYPVFFSAGMQAIVSATTSSAAERIERARQMMNVIYAATVLVAVMLLLELGVSPVAAMGAAALAAMGYYVVEYRDMVHFDQPALLGSLVLMWAIAGWYRGKGNARVYLATALAVLSGRGYASFAVLGLWWIVESLDVLRAHGMGAVRRIAAGVPTRACLLSIALAAACLSYNVTMEAKARGVPISDVSIVASAERRLSLEEVAGPKRQQLVVWSRLIGRQSQTLLRSLQPWRRVDRIGNGGAASIAGSLLLMAAALAFAWTREPARRGPLLVMALAGPVWIFAMRDLSSFHAYVGLFYFPFALVLFMALLHVLPARTHLAVVLIACSLGVWGTYRKNELLTRVSRITNQETADMQRIAGKLRDERRVTGVPKHRKLFPGVPFALGFYFPNHDVLVEGRSNLVITRDPEFDGTNLTPYNRHLFLYHMERPYRVRTALGGRRVHEKNQLAHQLRVLRDKGRRKKPQR